MRSHRGEVFAGQAPSEALPDQVVFQFGKEGEVFMLINIFSLWGGCALATANSLSAQLGDEVEMKWRSCVSIRTGKQDQLYL